MKSLLGFVLLALSVSTIYYLWVPDFAHAVKEKLGLEAAEVNSEDPLHLTGTVSANEVIVASKIDGRIETLTVREGDLTERGDLIAVLDRAEIEARREHQLGEISRLEAKLAQDRERVELEREQLKSQLSGAQAKLQVARSEQKQASAELIQLRKDEQRNSDLFDQGIVPRQIVERQETAVEVAEANKKALEDHISAAIADLELAQANQRRIKVADQEVKQTEAELIQARAELKRIQALIDYTRIVSPLSGMVTLRVAKEGEVVSSGAPIVTIVDLSDIWVRVEVEESFIGQVKLGDVLPIELASGQVTEGRVTFISPEPEFATHRDVSRVKRDIRTFAIKIALENPDRTIHPGMTASVDLSDSIQSHPAVDSVDSDDS